MIMQVMTAAVVAEALILAGLATLVVRLRTRIEGLRNGSTHSTEIAQMNALVAEAQALSEDLAAQFTEQVALYERLLARTAEQSALAATARSLAPEAEPVAHTPARKSAARTAASTATTRSRATRAAMAPTPVEEQSAEMESDLAVARQMGMDPLGVALQRGLRQRAATA